MTRKRKFWIVFSLLLLVLVLGAGGVFGYLYWLPRRVRQSEFPDWLEHHQRQFRIGSVAKSDLHSITVDLFTVGDADAPLLTAPRGALHFDHPADRNFHRTRFRKLVLEDVPLRLDGKQGELTVNGHPAAAFLERLTELPPGPDGGTIMLELHTLLAMPGSRTRTPCRIEMEREQSSGCFLFRGLWLENDAKAGSWEARLDRAKGELNFHVSDAVTVPFLQEFLLRTEQPAALAGLIQTGRLRGAGTFSADFPALRLKLLRFKGSLEEGELLWHGVRCTAAAPLDFTLEGTPQALELAWSNLALKSPVTLNIADFRTNIRARRKNSRFTAKLDVGPALLESLDSRFGGRWHSVEPMTARFAGTLNWKTGEWQCASQDDAPPASDWRLRGAPDEELTLGAERFRFEGKGAGDKGSCTATLAFRELKYQHSASVWHGEHGEISGQWKFHGRKLPGIALDFQFGKLLADARQGQAEFTRPAGQLEIRPEREGVQEFYLIAHAEGYLLTAAAGQLSGGLVRSCTSFTRRVADGALAVQSCELSTPSVKAVGSGQSFTLNGPALWAAAAFAPDGTPGKAEFKLHADELRGDFVHFTKPELSLRREPEAGAKQWQAEFGFDRGTAGPDARRWSAVKGKLKAASGGITELPESIDFSAEDFRPWHAAWKSEWNNSAWQLKRVAATRDYTGSVTTESARIQGPPGGGSVGRTEIGFQITAGADGQPESGRLLIDSQNPAWVSGDQQFGGEHLNGDVEFSPGQYALRAVFKNGSLIDRHLSVLAPLVNASGAFSTDRGFAGHVRFSGARAFSEISNLEGSDVSLDMPFVCAVPAGGRFPEMRGKLAVGKLTFLGHPEGSLEAAITQLPTGLRAAGKVVWSKFDNGVISFDTALDWSPRRSTGTFAMAPAALREPLNFNRWYPDCDTAAVAGKLGMEGSWESTPSGVKLQAVMQTLDSDWQVRSALLEGLSGTMEFSDLRRLISGNDAELRARRFRWRQWELADNRFQLSFQGSRTGTVSHWTGSFGSGKVRLAAPVHFLYGTNAPEEPTELAFSVEDVPLSPFFAKLGVEAVEGDAGLSGSVRCAYRDGTLAFLPSSLGFRAPTGKLLRFGALERYAVTIADANYQAFTLAVLKAMRCTSAQFDFSEEDRMLQMRIKADGAPAAPVPFVYQGAEAAKPFRNAKPDEPGFDGELELTVDLRLDLAREAGSPPAGSPQKR